MHDTEVIAAHWPIFSGINGTRCACGWRESMPIADLSDHAAKIWAAHVQAELARASTVTTEAELNALPEGTIIRWSGGSTEVRERSGWQWGPSAHADFFEDGETVTVLFRPV